MAKVCLATWLAKILCLCYEYASCCCIYMFIVHLCVFRKNAGLSCNFLLLLNNGVLGMTLNISCSDTVWYKFIVWTEVWYSEDSSLLTYDVVAKVKSWIAWLQIGRFHDHLKHWKSLPSNNSIISQNTWFFSSTAVRSLYLVELQ